MSRSNSFRRGATGNDGDDDGGGWGGGILSDALHIADIGAGAVFNVATGGASGRGAAATNVLTDGGVDPSTLTGQLRGIHRSSDIEIPEMADSPGPIDEFVNWTNRNVFQTGQGFYNLGEGALKGAQFAVTHPREFGQAVKTGVPLAWEAFKDDPLAIPQEMFENWKEHPEDVITDIALTIASGGAGALAKRGAGRLAAKSAAAEGAETMAKNVGRTASRRSTSRAAREAAEAGSTAVREVGEYGAEAASRASAAAGGGAKGWQAAREAFAPAGRSDAFLEGGFRGPATRFWEATTGHGYSPITRARQNVAGRIVGGKFSSTPRRVLGNLVAGGRPVGAGNFWRGMATMNKLQGAESAQDVGMEAFKASTNPMGYAMDKAQGYAQEHPEQVASLTSRIGNFGMEMDAGDYAIESGTDLGAASGFAAGGAGGWEGGTTSGTTRRRSRRVTSAPRQSNFQVAAAQSAGAYAPQPNSYAARSNIYR